MLTSLCISGVICVLLCRRLSVETPSHCHGESVIAVQHFRAYSNHCLTEEAKPIEREISHDLYSICYVWSPVVDLRDFSTPNAQPHCYTNHSTSCLQASIALVVWEDLIYFILQTLSVYRSTTTHREPIQCMVYMHFLCTVLPLSCLVTLFFMLPGWAIVLCGQTPF